MGCGYYDHAFNFHPSFSSASFPLFLLLFGYSGFFLFLGGGGGLSSPLPL